MIPLEEAWRHVAAPDLNPLVTDYYLPGGLELYHFPAATGEARVMPVWADPRWTTAISNLPPIMALNPVRDPLAPSPGQVRFLEDFARRKGWDFAAKSLVRDEPIFRLLDFGLRDDRLCLDFNLARFSESIMCQYVLEQEAFALLARYAVPPLRGQDPPREAFKIRNAVARDKAAIHGFFRDNVGRIGICNLILLRIDKDRYWPVVQKRGQRSLVQAGMLDPVSSGVFSVAMDMYVDFEIQHAVLREIYEELFGGEELVAPKSDLDPRWFYQADGIKDLRAMLADGRASFTYTGFALDLIRLVPEITTLTVVRDPAYFQAHNPPTVDRAPFSLNAEFVPTARFTIPRKLSDVDQFLVEHVPADPDEPEKLRGFDPCKWTLSGGFAFRQGLLAAVQKGLLSD